MQNKQRPHGRQRQEISAPQRSETSGPKPRGRDGAGGKAASRPSARRSLMRRAVTDRLPPTASGRSATSRAATSRSARGPAPEGKSYEKREGPRKPYAPRGDRPMAAEGGRPKRDFKPRETGEAGAPRVERSFHKGPRLKESPMRSAKVRASLMRHAAIAPERRPSAKQAACDSRLPRQMVAKDVSSVPSATSVIVPSAISPAIDPRHRLGRRLQVSPASRRGNGRGRRAHRQAAGACRSRLAS